MKFGIMFANSGPAAEPEHAAQLATMAEGVGIESLWTVEHVVVPSGYQSEYPYSKDGRMPGGDEVAFPDPLVWLAYVAGLTERIRLCTGILILPQRNPLITAKATATLDRLSGGRLTLGVGVGWLEEEFRALGVPWERRGDRTDEHIEAMRAAWTQPQASFHGELTRFDDVVVEPKPAQSAIPVVIGGHTPASARRAGRLGDGYFPARGSDERLSELFGEMRAAAEAAGRDPDTIELTTGARRTADEIKALADLGVDRVVIPPLAFDVEGLRTNLEQYAETVIAEVNEGG